MRASRPRSTSAWRRPGRGAALFDALPDVLQLDFDELPAWLCRATEAIRDELTLRRPGFRSVALRQAEPAS